MSHRRQALLLGLGALVYGQAAIWVQAPGYMDADYYLATGLQIARGRGLTEPFLWNYLDDPAGLPHPSHLYWMPGASALAAAGMILFGETFQAGRLASLVLAAMLPCWTARLAFQMTGRERHAWLAGALAAFPGFYLPFLITTDAFSLYALLGSGVLLGACRVGALPGKGRALLLGLGLAAAGLTRADGLLLLLPVALVLLKVGERRWRGLLWMLLGLVAGMAPWWWRNLVTVGSPFPPGASRVLWTLRYDELFAYPASLLTPGRWLAAGLPALTLARLQALGQNLLSLWVVNGLVFLLPLALWGGWNLRDRWPVRAVALYGFLLLFVMSLVFPFAGPRGGFLHSGMALMPFLWALTPLGLERFVDWGSRRRGWRREQACRVFALATVGLAALITAGLFWSRVVGADPANPRWSSSQRTYRAVAVALRERSAQGPVAVNNPPGFYLASGLPAVVIPEGGIGALEVVVRRYRVEWVVLEANHPAGLEELYRQPERLPWLRPAGLLEDEQGNPVHLLRVEGAP